MALVDLGGGMRSTDCYTGYNLFDCETWKYLSACVIHYSWKCLFTS